MKKLVYLIVLMLILVLVLTGCTLLSNVGQVPVNEQNGISDIAKSPVSPKNYSDVTIGNWESGNFSDVWDLTQCELTLSYTIDMSNIDIAGSAITEVGLREVGAPNLDPDYEGGFLLSKYTSAVSGNIANLNDYHVLMTHGWLSEYYDMEGIFPGVPMSQTVPWMYINYAFWFDRDGVDPTQETFWNYKDGLTYNTGGVYNVVIQYKALNDTEGVMYATINGEQQGFYTQGYNSTEAPEMTPVGRTFTGDMTQMQVFYGRGGGDGTVTISDIIVNGCLFWDECTVDLIAGQNEVAGMVTVDDDGDNLLITYETIGDWQMTETHLYVGKTDPKLLTSAPGQFPYSEPPDTPTSHTFTIPIADIDSYSLLKGKKWVADGDPGIGLGDQIYIAAHAEVIRPIIDCYETVWQIGDVDEDKLVIPYDEFNYPTLVTGTQDFYMDTTPTIEFPWISRYDKNYAPIINIYFNAEMLLGGRFLFSWSPGSSGTETIEVSLDGTKFGEVTSSGTSTEGWWNNQERFIDSFDVPIIEAGEHVLTINVTAGNGLAWDWLRLEEQCLQSETAWAEGDLIRPEKNWAMYFEYPCD